jgi:hypothetical protein
LLKFSGIRVFHFNTSHESPHNISWPMISTTRRIKKQFLLFLGAEGGRGTRDKLQGSAEECASGEMGTGMSSALWIRNDW